MRKIVVGKQKKKTTEKITRLKNIKLLKIDTIYIQCLHTHTDRQTTTDTYSKQ